VNYTRLPFVALLCCVLAKAALGQSDLPGQVRESIEKSSGKCAYSVLQFIYETSGYKYDPEELLRQLTGDRGLMSAATLLNSLRLHGLKADAYAQVPAEVAQKHLMSSPRHFVIVCSQPGGAGMGHAVVYSATPQGVVLYDDTKGLEDLDWAEWRLRFEKKNDSRSAYILVNCPEESAGPISTKIELSQSDIQLGVMDAGTILERTVEITNPSQDPVTIMGIKTPCRCLEAELSGRVLLPGAKLRLVLRIKPESWGKGVIQKRVFVTFADNSMAPIRLNGRLREEQWACIPKDLTVTWEEGSSPQDESHRTRHIKVLVETPQFSLNDYAVDSSLPFLELTPSLIQDTTGHLAPVLDIQVQWPEMSTLLSESDSITGKISVTCAGNSRTADIPVVLQKRSLFVATPTFLDSSQVSTSVSIRPRRPVGLFCLESSSTKGYEITAKGDCSEDELHLDFVKKNDTGSGPAIVRVRAGDKGQIYKIVIPVLKL